MLGATPWWLPQGQWSGDGTAYSEAVANTGNRFACSYRFLNDWASRNFAAINKPMVRGWSGVGLGGWAGGMQGVWLPLYPACPPLPAAV